MLVLKSFIPAWWCDFYLCMKTRLERVCILLVCLQASHCQSTTDSTEVWEQQAETCSIWRTERFTSHDVIRIFCNIYLLQQIQYWGWASANIPSFLLENFWYIGNDIISSFHNFTVPSQCQSKATRGDYVMFLRPCSTFDPSHRGC